MRNTTKLYSLSALMLCALCFDAQAQTTVSGSASAATDAAVTVDGANTRAQGSASLDASAQAQSDAPEAAVNAGQTLTEDLRSTAGARVDAAQDLAAEARARGEAQAATARENAAGRLDAIESNARGSLELEQNSRLDGSVGLDHAAPAASGALESAGSLGGRLGL